MSPENALEKMARIHWPERTGFYEVVQLYIQGNPHLIFAEFEEATVHHADMITSLAKKVGREYLKIKKEDFHEIPAPQSEWYKVCGMSQAAVDAERRTASFFGESTDYKMRIDADHLNSIKKLESNWEIKA